MHGFVADLLDFHSPLVGREDITKCDSDKGAFALPRFFPCDFETQCFVGCCSDQIMTKAACIIELFQPKPAKKTISNVSARAVGVHFSPGFCT